MEITEGLLENLEVVCGPYKVLHKELIDQQEVVIATSEEENEEK